MAFHQGEKSWWFNQEYHRQLSDHIIYCYILVSNSDLKFIKSPKYNKSHLSLFLISYTGTHLENPAPLFTPSAFTIRALLTMVSFISSSSSTFQGVLQFYSLSLEHPSCLLPAVVSAFSRFLLQDHSLSGHLPGPQ